MKTGAVRKSANEPITAGYHRAGPATIVPMHAAAVPAVYPDLPPSIYKVTLACWVMFIGVFWMTFFGSANALFQVAVSTAYAVMFFGVPIVMSRMGPRRHRPDGGVRHFLQARMETLYGQVNGVDALVQVIIVPLSLALGGAVIGFIIHASKGV